MEKQQLQTTPVIVGEATGKPESLSFGGYLVLYSQYIVIALLVLAALVLRLVFGAP
jgi:hypothetical protein